MLLRLRAWIACLSIPLLLGACSSLPERPTDGDDSEESACRDLYHEMDGAVSDAGVRDGGYARVAGFPYLRTNRFLASFRDQPMNAVSEGWWVERLLDLDLDARGHELANLPPERLAALRASFLNGEELLDRVAGCGRLLADADLSSAESRASLRAALRVPDEYLSWQRVLGLYPLTALPFLQGVKHYHAETARVLATPLQQLPVSGRLQHYGLPAHPALDRQQVATLLERSSDNPLRIPLPGDALVQKLYRHFAPTLVVDHVDDNDRIGMPRLDADANAQIDMERPVMLVRTAHTRFEGEALLQLVYSVWFPARPRTSAFDLLGGHLDGITWRVTLDRDGQPLLYDAMHNCGCYHTFFPSDRLRARTRSAGLQEPPLVGPPLRRREAGQRVLLRIASATHYIQNVRYGRAGTPQPLLVELVPDDALRSLTLNGGRKRSLFQPDGLVPGTERGERYLFWPMGVPEPGAMRQWGRHATAFVGRRHFDDPDLVERYFERR